MEENSSKPAQATKSAPILSQVSPVDAGPLKAIILLAFLKQNLLLIVGLTVLGAGLGWYLSQGDKNAYTTEMLVQANFNSTPQLTAQVHYYQSLINENDFTKLGKELSITSSMAASITTVHITPYYDEVALLKEYVAVTKDAGDTAQKALTFTAYKKAKKDIDHEMQVIKATGSNSVALNKAMDKLIALEPTTGINAVKTAVVDATWFKLTSLDNNTRNIDSLMTSVRKSINVTGNSSNTVLESLFNEKRSLVKTVDQIRYDWNTYQNIINVVSRHTQKGIKVQDNLIFKGALLFFFIALLAAVLPKLWKHLKVYEERNAA